MNKNTLIISISLFLLTVFSANPAYAASLPEFGSCVNPQGKMIASYNSGTHGIAGQSREVSGSDSVYQSSTNGVTQCFCPTNGEGIQTDWLKASKYSKADIDVLKNQGWTYVATGSSWGLEDVPYLAKNSNYTCRGNVSVNKPEKILGLASTGDQGTIYTLIISGAVFLISGMVTRRFSK